MRECACKRERGRERERKGDVAVKEIQLTQHDWTTRCVWREVGSEWGLL